MDICFVIDQISEHLFDEEAIAERIQELKLSNKTSDVLYRKNEIDQAEISLIAMRKRLEVHEEIADIYLELFSELEKFIGNQRIALKKEQENMDMEEKEDEDGSIEVEEDEELSEMKDNLEDHDEEVNDLDLESSNSKRSIHINSLNNFSRHLNRSKKSISILDLNGNFLMYDKLAKDQFEHIYRSLEKETLFMRMISESQKIVIQQYGKDLCQALTNGQVVLKYTIFSEKSRKKFNKELDTLSSSSQNRQNIQNLLNLSSFSDIYFAYLQCLTSNMFLIELDITSESLTQLVKQDQVDVNKKFMEALEQTNNQNGSFQAVMLVTRLSKKRQTLDIHRLSLDPLFDKFQMKTKRKIQKILNQQEEREPQQVQEQEKIESVEDEDKQAEEQIIEPSCLTKKARKNKD